MSFFIAFYELIIKLGNSLQSPFLLLVRIFWGFCFFSTGLGKLLQIPEVSHYFSTLNIPFPTASAYAASIIEIVGGTCLLFGFLSRLASIPLMCNMIVAYITAEILASKMFLYDPIHFITRTPFTFMMAALIIFIFGPGFFSIDHFLKKKILEKK